MGVLAGSGNSDSAGPVVVEVGQLVRQLLEVLGLEAAGFLHHVVASGVNHALLIGWLPVLKNIVLILLLTMT